MHQMPTTQHSHASQASLPIQFTLASAPITPSMPFNAHPSEVSHQQSMPHSLTTPMIPHPSLTAAMPSALGHVAQLPAEFRLVRNVARSSGITLTGPVVVTAPTPMPFLDNAASETVIRQVEARVAPVGSTASWRCQR